MATCPECDAPIDFDEFDVDKGDAVNCDECGTPLVVSSVSPLELDLADDEDEEEEDDQDDDEVNDKDDDYSEDDDYDSDRDTDDYD